MEIPISKWDLAPFTCCISAVFFLHDHGEIGKEALYLAVQYCDRIAEGRPTAAAKSKKAFKKLPAEVLADIGPSLVWLNFLLLDKAYALRKATKKALELDVRREGLKRLIKALDVDELEWEIATGKFCIFDWKHFHRICDTRWVCKGRYAVDRADRRYRMQYAFVGRLPLDATKDNLVVAHFNDNGLDNTSRNLRTVPHEVNMGHAVVLRRKAADDARIQRRCRSAQRLVAKLDAREASAGILQNLYSAYSGKSFESLLH